MSGDIRDALLELGLTLPEKCRHWNDRKDRFCTQDAIPDSEFCVYHGGHQQVQAIEISEHRKQLMAAGVPQAIVRLINILYDPREKTENVIRAATVILDRVGLGPIAGLVVSADETVTAPLEELAAALRGVAARRDAAAAWGDVQDAEVVDEDEGLPALLG